jgi:hypothetical protein
MRKAAITLSPVLIAVLSGCASSADDLPAAPTETVTVTVTATPEGPGPESTTDEALPPGYPKVVRVGSLPFPVRDEYAHSGHTRAVAVAPGVWTPLPPGAGVPDALASGVRDGFCASVKAYERKYAGGEQHSGTCW